MARRGWGGVGWIVGEVCILRAAASHSGFKQGDKSDQGWCKDPSGSSGEGRVEG